MIGRWLERLALRLVPRDWRTSVAQDLDEEPHAARRGAWWRAVQTAWLGTRLRGETIAGALRTDVRYALRSLAHAKGFTAGAAAVFALGIGINVAVFLAVDRLVFRPLPYGDAASLAILGEYAPGSAQPAGTLAPAALLASRDRVPDIVGLATTDEATTYASDPNGDRSISLLGVSWNMLRVLRVPPAAGRDFTEEDVRAGGHVVLLKYETWRAMFGGRSDIVGRALWRGAERAEIVGVLPEGFLPPPALFSPRVDGLVLDVSAFVPPASPRARATPPVVRLRPGVSRMAADAQLTELGRELHAEGALPADSRAEYRLMPIRQAMFGFYYPYVALVVAAAGLVLMLCCVNLASLLLVRARSRERVAAVQIALGASRPRVVGYAVVESLLLAGGGAACALVVLRLSQRAIGALLPTIFSRHVESVTDARVIGFAMAAAVACALAAAIVPSLRSAGVDVLGVLQQSAARGSTSRLRGGAVLLAIEAALGVVLVAGAAVTSRNLIALLSRDLGFQPAGLHAITLQLPSSPVRDAQARFHVYRDALDAARQVSGVRAAGGAAVLPVIGAIDRTFGPGYERAGRRWQVTEDFFDAMGMRLLAGRTFTRPEIDSRSTVAVLSERGAALVFPGRALPDVVGQVLTFAGEPAWQIVGVVSDVRGAYAEATSPSIYVPLTSDGFRFMMFAIRTDGEVWPLPALKAIATRVGGPGATASETLLADRLRTSVSDDRFRMGLFGAFGLVGLLLAAAGLYAVTAFEVWRRGPEMAVRVSLGARPANLRQLVIRQAVRPVAAGVAGGAIAAWWAGQFIQSFLHDVDARDPWTLAIVAVVLLVTAVAAAWIPARRAARVDPIATLRAP